MAYVTKDLNLVAPNVGGDGGSVWSYFSADALATIIAAGYIDDAFDKGLKVNDIVLVGGLTSNMAKVTVVDVSSNPSGDATLV